jgi:predicted RNase H-like nuclease (RuvC/YqgF family)
LKELQKDPQFDIVAIEKVSQAAGKIAVFINTVVEIYDKLQIINPKREALREAECQAGRGREVVAHHQSKSWPPSCEKIESLEQQLNDAKQKKDTLEREMQRCKTTVGVGREACVLDLRVRRSAGPRTWPS